ncbi:MAG: hypothetical protein ACFBZ8_11960 [Opitutales bacterium]
MNYLRILYNRLVLREKLMLTALVWVLVLVWLITWTGRFGTVQRTYTTATASMDAAMEMMQEAPRIDAEIRAVVAELDPSLTFDHRRLTLEVDSLARRLGLRRINLSTPRSEDSDAFVFHTMRFEADQASLAKLIEFEAALRERSPYISLESLKIDPLERNPNLVKATFVLRSFELRQDLAETQVEPIESQT